tara:strand:+ start:381 stop:1133 length:753 start_codon:yes stop_codon:yes gene_type:complete
MRENYFTIDTLRPKNGYQWDGDKITPIKSISKDGVESVKEEVIKITNFAVEDYYDCFYPFYELVADLMEKNRNPYPLVHEQKLKHSKVQKILKDNPETEQQVKDNLLSFFNKTGLDYIYVRGQLVEETRIHLGHLLFDFIELHNALADREPFMPPSKSVIKKLSMYSFEMKYVKNSYKHHFTNIFGAVWHSLVMHEWGYKPSNCRWCNAFILSARKDASHCPKPRECKNKNTNYKISKQREEKRNANKKA